MNNLLILNEAPYGGERSYTGLRLALSLVKREGESVRVFLMGDAASCSVRGQKTPNGYYNIETTLKGIATRGGEIAVCGSCMDARGIADGSLAEGATRGSMDILAAWTCEAAKVMVF